MSNLGVCYQDGTPCSKFPDSCAMCVDLSLYVPTKIKKKTSMRRYKKSDRMGASFEERINYETNHKLSASSGLTPNSGAGNIKGDIEISGCIDVALELKTKVKPKIARGSLTFTIQKEWLTKLRTESLQANKEFWALVFSFLENEKDAYAILEYNQVSDMIATMARDRIEYNKQKAEIAQLQNEISLLKTQLVAKDKEISLLNQKAQTNQSSALELKLNNLLQNTLDKNPILG